jgi:phosphomevalonate kinase
MLTGGYLVLHKPNNGLVMGVDARLHSGVYPLIPTNQTSITFDGKEQCVQRGEDSSTIYPIVILTPQLRKEPLHLQLVVKPSTPTTTTTLSSQLTSNLQFELVGDYGKNSFASKSLHYSLIAISSLLPSSTSLTTLLSRGLLIDIRGDRSFYSSQPVVGQEKVDGTQFIIDGTTITTETSYAEDPADYTTKTGLGSSAAVVSSLVTALFSYFGLFSNPETASINKTYAYRVAQVAHCIAQGKVGSGFDVATAFYGTQTYCRFSPSLLSQLMISPLENTSPAYKTTPTTIQKQLDAKPNPWSNADGNQIFLDIVTKQWDDIVNPFTLPPYINLILADVQGGSETPGMVKKVEEWKKNGEGAGEKWNELANANITVEKSFETLNTLSQTNPTQWLTVLNRFSTLKSCDWGKEIENGMDGIEGEIGKELVQIVANFAIVRDLLRTMGTSCDVPIEPPSQTTLIDKTCESNGVLFGGVPGAGGFDAVFAVVIDTPTLGETIRTNIINTWAQQGQDGGVGGGAIFCLPVGIDQNGGVQTRTAYKDFAQWS